MSQRYILHNGVRLTPHPERAVFIAPNGTEISLGQLAREMAAAGTTVEFLSDEKETN